jgi:hypothetical protein
MKTHNVFDNLKCQHLLIEKVNTFGISSFLCHKGWGLTWLDWITVSTAPKVLTFLINNCQRSLTLSNYQKQPTRPTSTENHPLAGTSPRNDELPGSGT